MTLNAKLFELLGIYNGPWNAETDDPAGTPGNDDIAINPGLLGFIAGGDGNDRLTGNDGLNTIDGGDGSDQIYGLNGADILTGGAGNDLVEGGAGIDILSGGAGIDTLSYEHSSEGVTIDLRPNLLGLISTASGGHAGGDVVAADFENAVGSNRADTLSGTDGANVLAGLGGSDVLNGNGGDDILVGGAGADTLNGGDGNDIASYAGSTEGITVDLTAGTVSGGDAAGDTLISIEGVEGGDGDDVLSVGGDDGAQRLSSPAASIAATGKVLNGGGGNDIVAGGAGNDTLYGGSGNDLVRGGGGDDRLYGGAGFDRLLGGIGNDTFYITDEDLMDSGSGTGPINIGSIDGGTNGTKSLVAALTLVLQNVLLDING
ncbi:MAG: calcium-binding protein, partial [Alphaproteobacteria bacterium]